MDFGRIIIGLFLIAHAPYKFWRKRISVTRMAFSVVLGLSFLIQGITTSPNYQMDKFLSKEQMIYWSYFDQFLTVCMIFLIARYFWELWKARKAQA